MTLNCIIVDDNSTQRLATLRLINNHPSLNLMGKFTSAVEAKKFLLTNHIDLIITEVNLSVSDGFDLLDSYIDTPELKIPYVIIISEDTTHAFKAFEYNAIDYLAKPASKKRFNEAIAKTVLQAKMKENFQDYDGEHIFVKSNLKKRKIYINEIKWIEALGDYAGFQVNGKRYVVKTTLAAIEEKIGNEAFVRVHRSYIVNVNWIRDIDDSSLVINGKLIPISRNNRQTLMRKLNLLK